MTFGKSEKSREDNFKTQGGETLELRMKTTKLKEKTQGLGGFSLALPPKWCLKKCLVRRNIGKRVVRRGKSLSEIIYHGQNVYFRRFLTIVIGRCCVFECSV